MSDLTLEQAWNMYLNIENAVHNNREQFLNMKYICHGLFSQIDYSVQRLCQAVMLKYNLNKNDYREFVRYPYKLSPDRVKQLDLSSIAAMVSAKIHVWEDVVYPMQAGHDCWTKGKDAGFYPLDSLQKNLDLYSRESKEFQDMKIAILNDLKIPIPQVKVEETSDCTIF